MRARKRTRKPHKVCTFGAEISQKPDLQEISSPDSCHIGQRVPTIITSGIRFSCSRNEKRAHKPVHYLGTVTDEKTQDIRNSLQSTKNPSYILVDPSTISAKNGYEFPHLMVLHSIYMSVALHQLPGRIRYAELLVLNRAIDPKRKKVIETLSRLKLAQIFDPAFDEMLITSNIAEGDKPSLVPLMRT